MTTRDFGTYTAGILSSVQYLDKVRIAGFLLLVQLFVWINASHMWDNPEVERIFMIYFVMMAVVYAVLDSENPLYKISIFDGLSQILFSFAVCLFIFSMFEMPGTTDFGGYESLGLLILAQALVIGVVEEFTFRGALPEAFAKGGAPAETSKLIAAASFSLFHVFVYDFNIPNLIIAFIFAIVMQYVWDREYPLACCGIHAAWNVVILAGAFSLWPFDVTILGGI